MYKHTHLYVTEVRIERVGKHITKSLFAGMAESVDFDPKMSCPDVKVYLELLESDYKSLLDLIKSRMGRDYHIQVKDIAKSTIRRVVGLVAVHKHYHADLVKAANKYGHTKIKESFDADKAMLLDPHHYSILGKGTDPF
jgi:hypothetical protein